MMNRTGTSSSSMFLNASSIAGTSRTARLPDFTNPNQSFSTTVNRSAISTSSRIKRTRVMCLVKGRGSAATETGIASMSLQSNRVNMSQFCDDQLYNQLITKIYLIEPAQLVVAQTLTESSALGSMFEKLTRTFPQCEVKCVPRRYMNENKGREIIRRLCSSDSSGIDIALQSKVYVLLAVSGLITYVEEMMSMYIAPHTIRMVYNTGENCMLIDHGTAVNLELLRSSNECGTNAKRMSSVFSVLNHTQTTTGSLMLRANLLEPPTESDLIELRYDAVEELLEQVETCASLHSTLSRFPDIENAISLSVQLPKVEGRSTAEAKLRNLLSLKTALDLVPHLSEALKGAESALLKDIRNRLMDEGLERILILIVSKLNSQAMMASGLLNMRGQLVFAVKHGLDGKLDAMRSVYNRQVDDIEDTVRHLSEMYQLALKLAFTAQRGFHVTLKIPKSTDMPEIPVNFIKISKRSGLINMTTDKLIILNARISECLDVIYNLSNRIVSKLLTEVHSDVECLNALVNAVGLLDMLVAFTQTSRLPDYVRPELGTVLAVRAARHPVAEFSRSSQIVPNDMFLSEDANFIILTGANNSGKSFYLRTVGVIQVIAQIGCFVPAEFAMIRVCDQLFSRIGSESSYSTMDSTFTLEMKEVAFVLSHQTPNMLILLDELCRGTSPEEAVDICFTICLQLIKSQAFTAFATHYKELCQLETIHENCSCFCMVTRYEEPKGSNPQGRDNIYNDYKLRKGIAKDIRYGLKLAATMHLPAEIVDRSFQIALELENIDASCSYAEDTMSVLTHEDSGSSSRTVHQIISEINLICQHEGPLQDKAAALGHLREKYRSSIEAAIKELDELSDSESPVLGSHSVSCSDITQTLRSANHSPSGLESLYQQPAVQSTGLFSPGLLDCSNNSMDTSSQDIINIKSYGRVSMGSEEAQVVLDEGSSAAHETVTAIHKLVDYPISPICPSGSSITNMPHSFTLNSPERIYRASTNKYVDARSSLSSNCTNQCEDKSDESTSKPSVLVSFSDESKPRGNNQSSGTETSVKLEPSTTETTDSTDDVKPSRDMKRTTDTTEVNSNIQQMLPVGMKSVADRLIEKIKEEPSEVQLDPALSDMTQASRAPPTPAASAASSSSLLDDLLTVSKVRGDRQMKPVSACYSKVKVEHK